MREFSEQPVFENGRAMPVFPLLVLGELEWKTKKTKEYISVHTFSGRYGLD